MADLSGRSIGGFRIERELLKGAQGRVYSAVCETNDLPGCEPGTKVVIKTMPSIDDTGDGFRKLSERTALLMSLDHANVVKYFGCFKIQEPFGELHAVVTEFLDGEMLKSRLLREPGGLDADMAIRIAESMALGLGAAAAAGVCHRDVKPANIFLCRDGSVKLIDFESARVESGRDTTTSSGHLAGSFDYMAPEFADPSFAGDEQSDVFSAGVVVHEMLTGMLPYRRPPAGQGQEPKSADFAFLERWTRSSDGSFANRPIVVSARIRRLLAHAEGLFSGALAPERANRFAGFADMLAAIKAVRFRELKSGGNAYRILQLVGKGGFGEVFKARLRSTKQTVAVKHLLNSDYADRFYREAKIMAQLDDPCFVKFIDFMVVDKAGNKDAFLVMDFLPGMPGNSLKDAIKRSEGGLPARDVLVAFARYARGLRVLHSRGIYHRDIKPANLYYPAGRPGDSAIMDLGIARDIHGTVTTGNVPGTFDYMAPEVVVEGSRGEAGTDIYALGHCLYEALTGKTGYPRLPKGYAAYAQFFKRAQTKEGPKFDDPKVTANPGLLALIVAMTEPELSRRIASAAEVERRLTALASHDTGDADSFDAAEPTITITATVNTPKPAPLPPLAPPAPSPRPPSPPSHPVPAAPPRRSRPVRTSKPKPASPPRAPRRPFPVAKALRISLLVGFLLVDCVAAWFAGPKIVSLCRRGCGAAADGVRGFFAAREARRVREAAAQLTTQADSAAGLVIGQYAASSVKVAEADGLRDTWAKNWRGRIPDGDFDMLYGRISDARSERIARDERLARQAAGAASRQEVSAAAADFDRERAAAAERVKVKETVEKAAEAALAVETSYQEDGKDVGDSVRSRWESDWQGRLPQKELKRFASRFDRLRADALKREFETNRSERRARILSECKELCETLEPVESRTSRLNEAEWRIRAAFKDGIIDDATFGRHLADIRRCRAMFVTRIVNRSDRMVTVGEKAISSGDQVVLVYTNGVPRGLAVVCRGFKPIEIGDRVNGRTLNLTPGELEADSVDVHIPDPGPGVVCRIDGAPVKHGVVKVMPGPHECTYSLAGHETQSFPFRVEIATPVHLPAPSTWIKR